MSKLKISGIIFLILISLLLSSLAILVYTNIGLRFITSMAEKFVPELKVEQTQGSLHNLTLVNLTYQTVGIDVAVGKLDFSISGSCLLEARLCITNLAVDNVVAKIDSTLFPPSPEQQNTPLSELSAPRPIELRVVSLNNIQLDIDGNRIELMQFSSGLVWVSRMLEVYPTQITGLYLELPVAAKPKEITNDGNEQTVGEKIQQLFSRPLLESLPKITLPIDITIKEFSGQDWQLNNGTPLTIQQINLQVRNKREHIKLKELNIVMPEATIDLSADLRLERDWPLSATLNATLKKQPKNEHIKLELKGNLLNEITLSGNTSGSVIAKINAKTSLGKINPPLFLNITSKKAQWPLAGEAQVQLDNFSFLLNGSVNDYRLAINSQVKGQEIPETDLKLTGTGNLTEFDLTDLSLDLLQGWAKLIGKVNWSNGVAWQSQLELNDIKTDEQYPDYPAQLSGMLEINGDLQPESWWVNIPNLALDGEWKQQKLHTNGHIEGNSLGLWQLSDVDILLGSNKINLNGQLGDKFLLDANIDLPELNHILPDLAGDIQGMLHLRGNKTKPQLEANLTASDFQWQGTHLKRAELISRIASEKEISGNVALKLEQLIYDNINIKELNLIANGSEKNHQLTLQFDGEPMGANILLTGSFDRKQEQWKGQLSDTHLMTPLGEWALEKALSLSYNHKNQSADVGQHCWLNNNAVICVSKPIHIANKGHATVELKKFNLSILQPLLSYELQTIGNVTGQLDVNWQPKVMPEVALKLVGHDVIIEHQVGDNALPIPFDALQLSLTLKDNVAEANWLAKISHNGKISANVKVSDPQNSKKLSGSLLIDKISLSLLQPIFSEHEDAMGLLNTNLRFAGNLKHPEVYGDLKFNDIKIKGNWLPVDMTAGDLVVKFNGMTSSLKGEMKTAEGQLAIIGSADWRKMDNWRANIKANGQKIHINLPPMVTLEISPDIEVVATPQLMSLDGKVDIPSARIKVEDLPHSAIDVSSDEVMLDNRLQPIHAKTNPIPIHSNLQIHIGDDVSLNAFGLNANLKGNLTVKQDKQGLGLHGQVTILKGNFHAYGQDLIIRKGDLVFAGPVSQPSLDIEAIRNPDSIENNVIAGVKVRGAADEPIVELFSDPAMEQQEVLSYILRGQGLESSGDSDNDMMTAMLISIGTAQSGKLVGAIGETFGVHDLTLDTQGSGDKSQVVVSGYVLPGLQVKYGIGIFDSLATLTLRYQLMPKLYLEAVSGLEQAVDMIYQFEF